MMPTWARPWTRVFCPAPWPCTSADGLSTRRYSAGSEKWLPSSNAISSSFSARFRRSSNGQRAVPLPLTRPAPIRPSGRRKPLGGGLVVAQCPRLVDEHDRDPVADRIGEPSLLADQLLGSTVITQRPLCQWADENFQQLRVDFRCPFHADLRCRTKQFSGGRRYPRSGAALPPSRRS